MKNISYHVIAWSIALCTAACSQETKTDTTDRAIALLESAQTLSNQTVNSQALVLLDSAMTLSDGNDTLKAYIYAEKANCLLNSGRMKEALPFAKQAITLAEKLNDYEILINQYTTSGILYRRINLPDSALIAYRKGLDIAEKVDAKDYVANLYNNISVLYTEQDRYKEGIEYADLAIKWAREAKDQIELYSAVATKSAAMMRMGRYKESIEAIAPEFDNILALNHAPIILKSVGPMLRSLVEIGRIDDAQTYMQKIKPILQLADSTNSGVIGILQIETAILHAQGEYRKEIDLWNRLEALAKHNGGIPQNTFLISKSSCYSKLGDTKKALELMTEAYAIADSLKNNGMSRQMSEFTIKYKTQEKELMIAKLAAERANHQTLIAILILALVLLAAIILFTLYRRHITRKENELALQRRFIEGLESERARLARELHDGVCNDLLGVQLALSTGKDNASQMVKHIMTDVRQISHELMPPRFNMENVAQILSDYIDNLPLPDCKVDFRCTPSKDDEQWNTVNTAVSFDIYRIVQELTGNIVRHAKPSFINVVIEKNDSHITLSVENDGAKDNSDGQGLGLQSMGVRVKSLNGEISHTDMGNGIYRVEVTL